MVYNFLADIPPFDRISEVWGRSFGIVRAVPILVFLWDFHYLKHLSESPIWVLANMPKMVKSTPENMRDGPQICLKPGGVFLEVIPRSPLFFGLISVVFELILGRMLGLFS